MKPGQVRPRVAASGVRSGHGAVGLSQAKSIANESSFSVSCIDDQMGLAFQGFYIFAAAIILRNTNDPGRRSTNRADARRQRDCQSARSRAGGARLFRREDAYRGGYARSHSAIVSESRKPVIDRLWVFRSIYYDPQISYRRD